MTNRAALLAAIKANPDDDNPRLVYADCIQEDGEDERAEWIRISCASAAGSPIYDRERQETGIRFHKNFMIDLHFLVLVDWHRGFISKVHCPWTYWLAHGDRLRQAEWVPEVELTTWPDARSDVGWHFLPNDYGTCNCWPGTRFKLPERFGELYAEGVDAWNQRRASERTLYDRDRVTGPSPPSQS